MTILDKIIKDKLIEVASSKESASTKQLESEVLFDAPTISMVQSLSAGPYGIIAEHKRRSPSRSVINDQVTVEDVAKGYEFAGVGGMSVLTDEKYFGGSLTDLVVARSNCQLPLLRKEFIIDEYQIIEAKAYGADAILLIAAVLSASQIKQFSELAKSLDLNVLLEIHNAEELKKSLVPSVDMIGVNNRNLKTFDVSLDTSKSLSKLIPDDYLKVSESGISSVEAIQDLKDYGFQGFLIGENFMKTENPGKSASEFIKTLNR